MKKLAFHFPVFILTLIFISLSLPSSSHAQVNIIEDWNGATLQKIQENFGDNAWVVVVGSPDDQNFINIINSYNFNWVIRGHAHWKPIGQKMYSDPEGAADDWNQFFTKLNKQVYFQPWNEPTSINPECNGDPLTTCAPRVARFINALNTSNIKLTTPALDPHNQENTAAQLVNLLKTNGVNFNKFDAATFNVYSPDLAKQLPQLLLQWGIPPLPIIVTESGVIVNGSVTYQAMPLCEDMFCNGVVDYWQSNGQIIGWAMFSNYQGWGLWSNQCVIDALKGICNCENCQEETTGGPKSLTKIVEDMFEHDGGQKPDIKNSMVGRNWESGNATMEVGEEIDLTDPSKPRRKPILLIILELLARIISRPVHDLFRPQVGQGGTLRAALIRIIAIIARIITGKEYNLGSQDLHTAHREGRKPGEDYYVAKVLETDKLELPGTTAQICLPDRDLDYLFNYIPNEQPADMVFRILNQMSIHRQVFNSLQAYLYMRHWASGTAYSNYLEVIDMMEKEGQQEMVKRSLSELFRAGVISRTRPGEVLTLDAPEDDEELSFVNKLMKYMLGSGDPTHPESPLFSAEDIEKDIGIADKALTWTCSGGDNPLLTELEFPKYLDDKRVDRKEVTLDNCEKPFPVHPSWMVCCDRNHVENVLGLNYDEVCKNLPDWACDGDEPAQGWGGFLWNRYARGKFASDSGISEADWPVYLEQCFVVPEDECERNVSFSGLFIDLTDEQRAIVFPPSTWEEPRQPNAFLTRHYGQCLNCQIVKIMIPEGLGALDACRHMTSTLLPGEMYEEMINEDRPERKVFSCDVGELPFSDGKEANKDNADYKNLQRPWDDERNTMFYTEAHLSNPGTTSYIDGVPQRHQTRVEIESYMHLYVPHYEKLELCTDFYYGLLAGENAEELEEELEEFNGNKLPARDLLAKTKTNDAGSVSAGLPSYTTGIDISANVKQDELVYLPGAGTSAGANTSGRNRIPAEWQEEYGWFSELETNYANNNSQPADLSNFNNWNMEPTNLLGSGPSLTETISGLRQIAQARGIPEELLLAKFWIEGGYYWDGGQLWCPAYDPNCHGSDINMYWIGLQHYLPNGQVVESYAGAHGIAQIVPKYHPEYDKNRGTVDWKYNAEYGADYLKRQYDYYGNWEDAVRGYHSPSEAEKGLALVKHFMENPPINPETGQPAWNPVPSI